MSLGCIVFLIISDPCKTFKETYDLHFQVQSKHSSRVYSNDK